MRWVVHIGAPKTGSTAIQRLLFDNRPRLTPYGFLYPDVSLRGYGHHDIAFLLHGQYPAWATPQDRSLADLGASLRAAIDSIRPQITILSSENFYLYPQPAKLRAFLHGAGMTPADELRIVCYVRRQDEALVSWYNQTVKAQGNRSGFETTCARDRGLWDYAERLKPWQDEFGTSAMVVRDYSPFRDPGGDVRKDFMTIAGLPCEAFELTAARANERVNRDILEFQRLVNRLPVRIPLKRRYHKRLIGLTSATAGQGIFNDSPFLSGSRHEQLVRSYAAGNAWVARTFLGRDQLFDPVGASPREGPNSTRRGLTPAKIALILKWMLTDHADR
jgi:hypothetical protein